MNDSAAEKPKALVENHLTAMCRVKIKEATVMANRRFEADLASENR